MHENAFMWSKGFEAGIAFALRHDCTDSEHFIAELTRLRTWNTHDEWKELVEKNSVTDEDSRQEH